MKVKFEKQAVEQWLAARSKREAILVYLAGFAVVYIVWNLFFEMPLKRQKLALENQIQDLHKMLDTQQGNLSEVERLINSSAFVRQLQRQQKLNSQSVQAGKVLHSIEETFVPVDLLARVTNDIIAQQAEVSLVSMKTFSAEPWLQTPGAKQNFSSLQGVYQHRMELEFRGTYFNAIAFLGHLEKLPWHLYWDHLDYQVLNYPEARVLLRFYVLSNEKG